MNQPNVVLAFSGGLDTSFCVKYLSIEKKMTVHAALVNTGGFSAEELVEVEKRAMKLGVASFKVLDCVEEFYQKAVKYLIFGNVLRNNTYPLSVSAERMFQAMAIANYANEINATAIAHGSTGAGNDQVRFDLAFGIIAPHVEVITPIRDLKLSRQDEIKFLKEHGVDWSWEKGKYSINKGLWGTSVGGEETLTSDKYLPEEAYPSPLQKEEPSKITLAFEQGELTGINGEALSAVQAIQKLEALASPYAIGRDTHVGDTIIGIKGRVGFEASASLIAIKAHHLLEKHTLTKWQQHWKEQLGNWYGMMLHEAQYLDPVMRDIEVFLASTQEHVSGEVEVALYPYRFQVLGVQSPNDLMNSKFGDYGEMNEAWTGDDVKGFTKILGNQTRIYHAVHTEKS